MSIDDGFKIAEDMAPGKAKGRSSTRTAPKPRATKERVNARALRDPLIELYGTLGVFTSMRNQQVGLVIGEQAEACADAWVDLAERNQTVARMLHKLTTGASMGALITAHMPIVMAVIMTRETHIEPDEATVDPDGSPSFRVV